MADKKHLVLVDGSGFIFRAFFALPSMSSPDGTPVNALFGFVKELIKLRKDYKECHIAVVFDAGRETFRNEIYADYKAHRPAAPEDLIPQFELIRQATEIFGFPSIELAGWEADDILATYARLNLEQGGACTILSSDKDLMQLVRPGVSLHDPMKNKPIGEAEILKKFGVPADKVIEVQALMGDSSDNVPGVPGIGPKNAAQLVQEYGTLEAILEAAPQMKPSKRRDNLIEYAEKARISKKLVLLDDNVPVPIKLDLLKLKEPDEEILRSWLEKMGFNSLLSRLGLKQKENAIKEEREEVNDVAKNQNIIQPPFGSYEMIISEDALNDWCSEIRRVGYVGVDTETTSLNVREAQLVGISLAIDAGKACYIPLRHYGNLESRIEEQIEIEACLEILRPILEDPSILKIFQNAKYDLAILNYAGLSHIAPVDDTMLLSYVQHSGKHAHNMDALSEIYLNHKPIAYEEVTGQGSKRVSFAEVSLKDATAYAAEDADITLRLWKILKKTLVGNKSVSLYETIERPLIAVLAQMEARGIKIDAQELRILSSDFEQRMKEMEAGIYQAAGREFNLASPKQLGEILYDDMGLSGGKKTKTGAWKTDVKTLDMLSEKESLPQDVRILVEGIIAWRQLAKLKSTYTDALLQIMDQESHHVHTNYHMTGTLTGRLSSNDPNLQNIPIRTEEGMRIRKSFIAKPGYVLLAADYSQIELRLLAHVAAIETLKEAFHLGQDIHARTASEVFSVPLEGMDSLTRRRAKAINFGIIYGISAFGLARQLQISNGEAQKYIKAYFNRYPGIYDYMERMKEKAREQGYVTSILGRRCYIPKIRESNKNLREYAERQAINAPLQGGAADIIKKSMIKLAQKLPSTGFDGQMLLQVHDELLFEVKQEEAENFGAFVKEIMENIVSLDVPLLVEVGIGKNWSEAH